MTQAEKSYERGEVVQIIQSVIDKIDRGTSEQKLDAFKHEIAQLFKTIEKLKMDIAATYPKDLKDEKIPGATDELDAVVSATAEATNIIMSSCEAVEKIAGSLELGKQDEITNHITLIYEACGFQDITGQRIKKVVTTLKEIESRISALMDALNMQVGPIPFTAQGSRIQEAPEVVTLMNGPQLPEKAISQDDIDKLLAEFDK